MYMYSAFMSVDCLLTSRRVDDCMSGEKALGLQDRLWPTVSSPFFPYTVIS